MQRANAHAHTVASVPLVHRSRSLDPYENLALEHELAACVRPGEWLLFLWRNERTVVVGRNQNAWAECDVRALEADGGRLARRQSGGGAVFHDAGNLNFTFVAPLSDYDLSRNLDVVRAAVASFGLDARVSGRNDVTVEGAKFCGNAFFRSHGVQVHHGTLMVGVQVDQLARYLRPDPRKLQAKGIKSVRSRVVNLASLDARITVDSLSDALTAAFERATGASAVPFPCERLDPSALDAARDRFSSWEWRLGAVRPFTDVIEERFDWGAVEFRLNVVRGAVSAAAAYSDALDAAFVERMARSLEGARYHARELGDALSLVPCEDDAHARMIEDCRALFRARV